MEKTRGLINVTVTLAPEVASRARVKAAQHNMSLSRYVGQVMDEHVRKADEYEEAMRRFLGRKPVALKGPSQRYATREEIHERPGVRRR